MSHVVVIAAHPDDAELAVGGVIAWLREQGRAVTVVFLTVSEPDPSLRPKRIAAAEEAAKVLGHNVRWFDGGRHDQVEDIPEYQVIRLLDALFDELRPTTVISHWEGDSHGDHVRTARAVVAALRRWPATTLLQFGPNEHRTVRFIEFVPNVFVPVEQYLDRKLQALSAYSYAGQGFRPLDTDQIERFAAACGSVVQVAAAEGLRLIRCRLDGTGPLIG